MLQIIKFQCANRCSWNGFHGWSYRGNCFTTYQQLLLDASMAAALNLWCCLCRKVFNFYDITFDLFIYLFIFLTKNIKIYKFAVVTSFNKHICTHALAKKSKYIHYDVFWQQLLLLLLICWLLPANMYSLLFIS